MHGPRLKTAIPVLRIFSVDKAREFYVDFLGFSIDWEHRSARIFPFTRKSPDQVSSCT